MVNLPLIDDTLAIRLVGTEDYTSGWIDRIVADPFPLVGGDPVGTVRGDVQDAPIEKQYPGSNAYQIYAARVTLLWKPMDKLSVTPSFFHETSTQNGISAYDSVPGTAGALPAFRHRRTADRFPDGLQPQCELQFPDVRPDIEHRAMDPKLLPGGGGERGVQ